MPETTLQTPSLSPLTSFTEDEIMFRDNIRQFADEKVRPLVKEMDEKGVFDKDLIQQFFQLGLMGIEIPEQYGGGGGKFFEAILAVEEMSRVDASAGVVVDVQNTLVNNALLRWGSEEQRKQYLAAHGGRHLRRLCAKRSRIRIRRLRLADPRNPEGQRLRSERTQALDHERQGSRPFCFIRYASIPRLATRGLPHSSSRKTLPGSPWARRKTNWGFALRPPAN